MTTPVVDPFGVANDVKMPFLVGAISPLEVQRQFKDCLPLLQGEKTQIHLTSIRVTRYKPERRCLIEYNLEVERPTAPLEKIALIGKARSRGLDRSSYHLLQSLWNAGFAANSADGISVPEPIGIVPEFQMWFQRQVPGAIATQLLAEPDGVALAKRIAQAIHKLHQAGVPASRRHTMADELRILDERLPLVAQIKPQWTQRLTRLLDACVRLGNTVPEPNWRSIHRDFYPDQAIADDSRLYLLDFDLYCEGDPALDLGNFLGHLTEQSLRTLGTPDALSEREKALTESFLQLSPPTTHTTISAYKTLTLVRHIYLSTKFPERCQFTEPLLELCEQRLAL
jgi:Phosphotransferase enzyme family